MPSPIRREYQIAAAHHAFVAVDRGVAAFALDDEADCRRAAAMAWRNLSRHDDVDGAPQRVGRRVFASEPGIDQCQHSALAAAFERHQLSGFEHQAAQLRSAPQKKLHF